MQVIKPVRFDAVDISVEKVICRPKSVINIVANVPDVKRLQTLCKVATTPTVSLRASTLSKRGFRSPLSPRSSIKVNNIK